MASRVNTKFVVLLAVALVVLCGGVVVAFTFLLHSGSDLARMGDRQMAAGKYKDAADLYSKAVNKEKTNIAFLKKWRDALSKQTPETQVKYMDAYQNMIGAMRQLAMVDKDNAVTQREYLDLQKKALDGSPFSRGSQDSLIRDIDNFIAQHPGATGPAIDQFKRYRGLARLRVAIEAADATPDYLDGAKADLDAAIAADPGDSEVARALERYYLYRASKADAAAQTQEALDLNAKGGEVVDAFLKQHPESAIMQLIVIRRRLEAVTREMAKKTEHVDLVAASDKFRAEEKPELDKATAAAMATPPDQIDGMLIGQLRQLEMTIDPAARQSRTEALIRAALAAKPQNAQLISALAELLESRDEHAAAVAQLQQIVDMPAKPVSLEGAELFSQKPEALFRQGLWTVRQWQAMKPGPDRDAVAEQAKSFRAKLAAVQDASGLGVMMLDAELAFVEGDYRKANRLLDQFNTASHNASVDALMLGAEVALRLNEPGSAKERLEMLLRQQPNNLRAVFILAGLEMQLQNYERASRLYGAILEAAPDNSQAKQELQLAKALLSGGTKVADPIVQALIEAESASKDSVTDPEAPSKAAGVLREKMKTLPDDYRLWRELANLELRAGNKDAAIAAAKTGLAAHPDSKELQALNIGLAGTDPTETTLALIDAQDWPELQKLVERYTVLRSAGQADRAKESLVKAAQLAPDDPAVIELQFMAALEDKQYDKAKAYVDRAVKEDLDKASGDTYRARYESAQGNNKEALRIMDDMVKRGGAQPESWRLKGRLENLIGRGTDAVTSFRKALELRPTDVPTIKDLLNTQVALRQSNDALNTARQYQQFAQGDQDFVNVWLTLEAGMGNRDMAVQRRERIARLNPKDRDNNMALAALYMDMNRRADARPLLDNVRSTADGLDAVNLDAGWYWADSKRDQAKDVFEKYIAAIDKSKLDVQPFLVYAQFLLQRQDAAAAMAVLERARAVQRPEVAEADKAIADTYLTSGNEEEGIKVCQRIIDAKADTATHTYYMRMIEAMITKRHYAEAEALLKPTIAGAQSDAVPLLLAADCRNGLGDSRGRLQLLDRAVSLFPSEPMVFVKRAQALLVDPDRIHDAIDDLTRALTLDPRMAAALRLRATAYDLLKDSDKSIADLRAALVANPGDDALLGGLLGYLLKNNRDSDAAEVARQTLDLRKGDAIGRYAVGNVFAAAGRWELAAQFQGMAFEIDQQDAIAQRYLDCLLAGPRPNLAETERVLTQVLKPARVEKNPGFLMAQAKLLMKQSKTAQAGRSAADAFHLIKPDNAHDAVAWFGDAQRLQPDAKQLATFIENLMREGGPMTEWLAYFRATLALQDPAARSQGLDQLRNILQTSKNPQIRQASMRSQSAALYELKQYEDAANSMRASVQEFPNDPETLNNLAYLLTQELKKPAEALPFIEQAIKLRPDSAETLDTLGLVQLQTGKVDESIATLTRAQSLAANGQAAATIYIHLADATWTSGKKDDARKLLDTASSVVDQLGTAVPPQTKADLDALKAKMAAP